MFEGDAIHVLLADDHDAYRDGLARALGAAPGLSLVGEARDGREAVDLIVRLRPHVAVVDVRMPLLDGLAVCREVRGRGLATRLLLLSAIGADGLAASAADVDAAAWVGKDSSREEICTLVAELGRAARSG